MSQDIPTGDALETDDLYELVYEELRSLARAKMHRESMFSTLQATALVHEAWLRLGGDQQPEFHNRAHFFAAAAEAMQRILVDRARRKKRQKHGGSLRRISIENLDALQGKPDAQQEFLLINDALDRFSEADPSKAKLVKLRYFLGLSFEETAQQLGISSRTAKRWWDYARSWLHCEITST